MSIFTKDLRPREEHESTAEFLAKSMDPYTAGVLLKYFADFVEEFPSTVSNAKNMSPTVLASEFAQFLFLAYKNNKDEG